CRVPIGMESSTAEEVFEASNSYNIGNWRSSAEAFSLDSGSWAIKAEPTFDRRDSLVGPGYAMVTISDKCIPIEIRLALVPGVVAIVENTANGWDFAELEAYCIKVAEAFEI